MTETGPWRPEDTAAVEAAYGQTMDELVAEAERGYCTTFGRVDRERGGVHMCGRPAKYYIIWQPSLESPPALVCDQHMAQYRANTPELILTAQTLL